MRWKNAGVVAEAEDHALDATPAKQVKQLRRLSKAVMTGADHQQE